ncbi:hypothetical protein SAMN05443245_5186 [Paraburkholderia fungorum]|uniref:DUF1566 domain-containing protein n=1 Tax=Paraburkholderia fungorum TaxID=134537 RepID=A0A1H1IHA0_9BURK|nr:DUF1566 domain-containing protein [Paraburkholderia fungorum]SDR37117.1 hypothetical protein SAMN05443245_5186 [Paraburkholderia fungorum]
MQQLQIPPLAEGEVYVGAIGDKNGDFYHVVLLPGDSDDATFDDQLAWAKSIGGGLPTRVEQAMLWAGFRDLFQKDWYWSNETHHRESGWAWFQNFSNGYQILNAKVGHCRARVVRRLPI